MSEIILKTKIFCGLKSITNLLYHIRYIQKIMSTVISKELVIY